jgi:hypothetical protein
VSASPTDKPARAKPPFGPPSSRSPSSAGFVLPFPLRLMTLALMIPIGATARFPPLGRLSDNVRVDGESWRVSGREASSLVRGR